MIIITFYTMLTSQFCISILAVRQLLISDGCFDFILALNHASKGIGSMLCIYAISYVCLYFEYY
jgi:hypothetical protein